MTKFPTLHRGMGWIITAVTLALSVPATAYVEAPYTLGRICTESTNIVVLRLESVDKEKNLLIYRKVRDLKGTHPGETVKHMIAHNGFQPREWQNVMAWAEVGQIALFFHNGAAGETCINGYWYQVYPGDWWSMSHAEPYLLRSFSGKPEKCITAVEQILAGQETTVPCMVDGDKEALQRRTAKLQRLKASLKIQDYVPDRDFVGWGVEEFKPILAMNAFSHIATLVNLSPGAIGVSPIDYDGDGKIDLLLYGANKVSLLQNAGGSLNEVSLPINGLGARGAAWADYNGDGKPDLILATPAGPRLLANMGNNVFRDETAGLPAQDYYNLTAAAFFDYDGDGKPDILLADGFQGLRLYRNIGKAKDVPLEINFGKWQQCGPFDNTGNRGYDAVYPPEQGYDAKGEYPGKNDQKAIWRDVDLPEGQATSVKIYREQDHAFMTVYLHRQITTNKNVEVPISLGGGGPLSAWLNGQRVLSHNEQHQPAPDQAKFTLKLKAGVNDLLIKACFIDHGRSVYVKTTVPTVTIPKLFEDVSDAVGLGSNGAASSVRGDRLIVADVDGDGRPDVLFTGGNGVLLMNTPKGFVEAKDSGLSFHCGKVTPIFSDIFGDHKLHLLVPQADGIRLFRNDGHGHFTDATSAAGDLAKLRFDAACVAVGDFAGNKRNDILIGCIRGPNRILANNGNGTFTDISEQTGLSQRVFNTRATAVIDFNRDGVPDVAFVNEGQESALLLGRLRPVVTQIQAPIENAAAAAPLAQASLPLPHHSGPISWTWIALGCVAAFGAVFGARHWGRVGSQAAMMLLLFTMVSTAQADWLTSRGNPARTGTDDTAPGPKHPRVRWVYKSHDQFVASPAPASDTLFVSGLGEFNTASFYALALNGDAPERVRWSKSQPYLPLPTVAPPALVDGLVIFGDGMHQTDGATLYCLHAGSGRPIWQYPFPGKLVHLEQTPTIANGKAYVGGGNAGVICIDYNHIAFEGNELNAEAVRFAMDKKWADLNAKYAAEKKKDPNLAIPPSELDLPKAQPKLTWQMGKDEWHVDAPLALANDRLIVASAYVDEDKAGKRTLECLNATTGAVMWETPLEVNPWGGPSIAGDLAIVACSNIRFDKKLLPKAKGQVVAVELATGKIRWKKDFAGGVLSAAAISGPSAIFGATDGHIYCVNVADGNVKWNYDGKQPFFGGPAVSGGMIYAADLKGTVHAVSEADGVQQWTVDALSDPSVASPGMVFGSITLHGGELFLATNRLEMDASETPLAVICLSDQAGLVAAGPTSHIAVDAAHKTITVPARIAPRKLAYLKEIYPLEVVACWPHPLGQKAHETVVNFDARPSDIHNALVSFGLKPGTPARGEGEKAVGPEVDLYLMIPGLDGKPRRVPLEKAMCDPHTAKPLPKLHWIFTGSVMRQPDPDKPAKVYGADLTGTLISIVPVTDETVFQTNLTMKEEPLLKLEDNVDILPPEGTPVELVIQAR